jgi:hypothetical protein
MIPVVSLVQDRQNVTYNGEMMCVSFQEIRTSGG